MRAIFFKYHTGYCGEDGCEVVTVDDNVTEDDLSYMAYQGAYDHASSYGRELCDSEDDECEMEHEGNTNIEGTWEDYVPEKHDQLL